MIILLNGCINAGKSSVAQALARVLPNTAHIELDDLRHFYSWMPLDESIPVTLEATVAVTRILVARGMHAVLTWPLRNEDYVYLIKHLGALGVPILPITLDASAAKLLSNRGERDLTDWEKSRIVEMRVEGYHLRTFGATIDTSERTAEETAEIILGLMGNISDANAAPRIWAGKKLGAAAVICDDLGRVLMVKHSYGKLNWEIPGGAAEPDEPVHDTAVREVFEETGLVVTAERLTGVYYMPDNDSHHFVFICKSVEQGKAPGSVSEETTDCGFFSPDALPRPISDFTLLRIKHALEGGGVALPTYIGPRVWLE